MSVDQLYANGRIAVMSTRLFGADKFTRLAESNTLAEAVRLLAESGYGGGAGINGSNDYETLLIAELDEALKILKETCLNKNALKYFLAKYDYLNAKALMKCKYMRVDGTAYCYNEASVSPKTMQTAFVNDDYSVCTKNMAEACDAIDAEYANGNRSPSVIDVLLDKAMYRDMLSYSKKCKLRFRFVKEMCTFQADSANLMSLYRVRKANMDKSVYENLIVDGGSISKQNLLDIFGNDGKAAELSYEYKRFYALCTTDRENLFAAEAEQKARLYRILRDNADLSTIQPVLEYFFNKVNEIERIRRIFAAIKSGADKDEIKDMLK